MRNLLSLQLPFYATRPSGGDGMIGTFYFNALFMIICFFLFWVNFLVWGVVGLVVAFRVLF